MKNFNCPLCKSLLSKNLEKYHSIGLDKNKIKIVQCNSCNHFYSSIDSDVNLEKNYKTGAYKLLNNRHSISELIASLDDKNIINNLSSISTEKKLLDFGSGKGRFIYNALTKGWKVTGLETSKERAQFSKDKYSLKVSNKKFEEGTISEGPFNVITLLHVLEHLNEPKKIIKELCENNLLNNGFLVIEVPLFNSLQSKIAGSSWIHLDPPLHLSHFTKKTLISFLNTFELKPIKFQFFSFHVGVLGMVQSLLSIFGYKKMLIEELKFRRSIKLLLSVSAIIPIAFILEVIASLFQRGGVIRVYLKKRLSPIIKYNA